MGNGRELSGHQPRCAMPLSGWQAVAIGAGFLLVTAPAVLMSLGVIPARLGRGVPLWAAQAATACLLAVGVYLTTVGLRALAHRRRREALHAARPDEPWFADYAWSPDGIHDDNRRRMLGQLVVTSFLALFLSAFNWWAFVSDSSVFFLKIIVGLLDVGFLVAMVKLLRRLACLLRFGRGYVRFCTFPLRLGTDIELRFGLDTDIRRFERIRFRLRFVEEAFVTRGASDSRTTQTVMRERYADEVVLEGADIVDAGEATVRFSLPGENVDFTRLADRPPRYWELEVGAEGIGGGYWGLFPLPVYLPAPRPVLSPASRIQSAAR